jgi:hypothetical protein
MCYLKITEVPFKTTTKYNKKSKNFIYTAVYYSVQ